MRTTNLRLYNSQSKRKERFSLVKEPIGLYVCGITPDGAPHLGHAFTYSAFDVLVRYFRHLGYQVKYVQNLTDIDDDILARSEKAGKNWREFGNENTQTFFEDLRWLNIGFPDVFPRATDHIPEMQAIIKKLLKKKLAYESGGNVYFSVKKDKDFGSLSGTPKRQMLPLANQRGNKPDDPNKKDPLDFVLWQASRKGEPSWSSPWGKGRPGWHIECSAMSMKYLGQTLDIHGGGRDLIFPHHECSRTQSECSTQKQFVRYWLHTGMLRFQGEKMSKSLGNLVFLKDLRARYNANDVRLCLLAHHYRSVWEFDEKEKQRGEQRSELLKEVWQVQSGMGKPLGVDSFRKQFYGSLNDDLNTPRALVVVEKLARQILKEAKKKNVSDAKAFLQEAFSILGLRVEMS